MRSISILLRRSALGALVLLGAVAAVRAQQSFDSAAERLEAKLEQSLQELDALRQKIADEKLPLSQELSRLESQLLDVRLEYQQKSRLLDSRVLDLSNLRSEIKGRKEEATYIGNLLSEYQRNFSSGLHVTEHQRYASELDQVRLAVENTNLSRQEVFAAQLALLQLALGRLSEAGNGTVFDGRAVGAGDLVQKGKFVLVGPAAIFRSDDGGPAGSVVQQIDAREPVSIPFGEEMLQSDATAVLATMQGSFPLDPTLGDALKIAATEITLWQEIQKGGIVMIPIFALAAFALLVALVKWITLVRIPKASKKRVGDLLQAVQNGDEEEAHRRVKKIKGPVGRMLAHGVEHMRQPRALVEEILYESVLKTRLKLQRMLPFIAISAASAPLLGLLGTVTGIITTFKLMTVFGSGDPKSLSAGISEALITTKYGLIVAIPSLLLHAFLSRKARGIVGEMETNAVTFVNQLGMNQVRERSFVLPAEVPAGQLDPTLLRRQVNEILRDMLGPVLDGPSAANGPAGPTGSLRAGAGHAGPGA